MAYVSPELKAKLAPSIKAICKKYGVKASIAVRNHSTLVLNIASAPFDMVASYNTVCSSNESRKAKDNIQVNEFYYKKHFEGQSLDFLKEVIPAMNVGNHDNSDTQTDFFDVGFYISVNVGKWDKPFTVA